jgi:hypothetical protein
MRTTSSLVRLGRVCTRGSQNPPDARNRRNPWVTAVSRGEPYEVRLFPVKPDDPVLSLFPHALDPDGRRLEP